MNVQHVQSKTSAQPTNDKMAIEFDPTKQQRFEAQFMNLEEKGDLLQKDDARTEKKRVDEEESSKNRKKSEQTQEAAESNLATAMMNQAVLRTTKGHTIALENLTKAAQAERNVQGKLAEQAIQGKVQQKNLNYTELVKERVAEKKADLIVPTIQKDGTPETETTKGFADLLGAKGEEAGKAKGLETEGFSANSDSSSNQQGRRGFAAVAPQTAPNASNGKRENVAEMKGFAGLNKGAQNTNATATSEKSFASLLNGKANAKAGGSETAAPTVAEAGSRKETKQAELEAKPKTPTTARQEAENVKEVVGKVKVMLSNDQQEVVMKLSPEHLGKLEVRLRKSEENRLTAELSVENAEAKDLLERQIGELRKGLEEQGVHVDDFSIVLKEENESTSFAFNERQGGQQERNTDSGTTYASTRRESTTTTGQSTKSMNKAPAESGLNIIA